jgi:hypothetical protein
MEEEEEEDDDDDDDDDDDLQLLPLFSPLALGFLLLAHILTRLV